jgi:hypothetical protein
MLNWVNDVLKPYVATASVGIITILFLDSFKVHLLGSVTDASRVSALSSRLSLLAAPVSCSQSTSELTSHSRRT